MTNSRSKRIREIATVLLVVVGLLSMLIAMAADLIGLDITPGFGLVQMVAFLFGLTLLTIAAYMYLISLRPKDAPKSLQADIGIRLSATGLILTYVVGLSDTIGIGTHVNPSFDRPFIGPLQLGGFLLGIITLIIGMILYHTSRGPRETSSLEFLVNGKRSNNPSTSTDGDS